MTVKPIANQSKEGSLLPPYLPAQRGDKFIRLNISRNTLIAIVFSLMVHGLILLLTVPHIVLDNASTPQPTAMEVSLAPPMPVKIIEPIPQKPMHEVPVPSVAKPPKVIAKKSHPNVKPSFTVPEVLTKPVPSSATEAIPVKEPVEKAPTDMASYVKQQQAKRNLAEADAAKQNAEAVAREVGPSVEQIRDERIKSNFKNGTNGIFEITSLSGRHAAFAFNGWTNDYSHAKREYYEVEASTGQDVRRVMIKKMIALIRQHYDGDFNWRSQRLDRVVIQSARPADSAELEDFMMMEFFGSYYKNASAF